MRKWYVIHEFSVYGGYTTILYLKRNIAGGEKKRVSEIERERASRAVGEQPTFRRWITTQFLPQRA